MEASAPGNAEAVRQSITRYIGPLHTYVHRRVRQHAVARGLDAATLPVEELVSETVATALRRFGGKAKGVSLYEWLRQVARGVIRREVARLERTARREVSLDTPVVATLRVAGVRTEEEFTLADIIADPAARLPDEECELDELWEHLDRTFSRLPEAWREIFLLHAVDGLSLREVAEIEGRPLEAIIHSISQTREFLRAALEEYEDLPRAA